MVEFIRSPRYPVASISVVVFNTGEAGLSYENLGPIQVMSILLKLVNDIMCSRFTEEKAEDKGE